MDDNNNTPLTFTNLSLIVLLVIIIFMFVCHFLGPRATTWMRSNKEEKIGLSKNKLFHANGYMIQSGSEFLLSSSGSFKRFDTIDKEDFKQSDEEQPTQHTTTTLWNLANADYSIPPQPLRPAPGISNHGKSVTFSFNKLNEMETIHQESSSNKENSKDRVTNDRLTNDGRLVSCMRSNVKNLPTPQPIEGPPPPRLTTSSSAILSATAIPRPIAKRQISHDGEHQQNNLNISKFCGNDKETIEGAIASSSKSFNNLTTGKNVGKQIMRRNSSTNPFLCESLESLPEKNEPIAALQTDIINDNKFNNNRQQHVIITTVDIEKGACNTAANLTTENSISSNPFFEAATAVLPNNFNLLVLIDEDNGGTVKEHQNPETQILERTKSHKKNHQTVNVFNLKNPSYTTNATTSRISELQHQPSFRNRSYSETENTPESDLRTYSSKIANAGLKKLSNTTNPFTGLTQKVKGPHMLQKTISEDFLFRKLGGNNQAQVTTSSANANIGNTTWCFGRSFLRQDSSLSLFERRNSSQCSLDSTGSIDSMNLERATSCDSVNSDSSVFLSDLDQPYTQITGYLCIALQYDKNAVVTGEGMELAVTVLEAKGLICPFNVDSLDTFVRIYLVPDQAGAMQTRIFKNSQTPNYNESFTFWLKKQNGRHSLWFHLYHNGVAHTLIGEAEMEIDEMPRPITTWIPLSDSRKCNAQWGELMFSLSYLPTAERLTIVVVKARNLKLDVRASKSLPKEIENVFVKIYLMNNEKKVLKKRTSLKRKDRCPIFNESMIFSVPPHSLTTVQLRLTVFGVVTNATIPLGHVIAGSYATGKGLRHWHQMLSSLRKPCTMWHVLRRATNQPIFTGGAEAVVAAMQSQSFALRAKRNSVI